MAKIISGIQQIGIGIPNMQEAWKWYRQAFGMDIRMFEEAADAPLMINYTGGKVQSRTAALAVNMMGGGGFEIWQYTSRTPDLPNFEIQLGDLGIFAAKIKVPDISKIYDHLSSKAVDILNKPEKAPDGNEHFFIKDPYGNIFELVEGDNWFTKGNGISGGAGGCIIGVSDIDKARKLYSDILGYDKVVYDEEGTFEDLNNLPGGGNKFRRVLLNRSVPVQGSFSKILGPGVMELVQVLDREPRKIFENRYWGDRGFIHLCFDIYGMDDIEKECAAAGFPFTVDSSNSFDMGEASGRFSYIEDPDGTLIEFVETHKIPIIKKIGWYLSLQNKDPKKPLPNWILKMLSFNRVKD